MFKGFNFVESTYEVISPKLGISYLIRALKVGEELSLKTSVLVKRSSISKVLNNLVFEVQKDLPEFLNTKQKFIELVPDSDKELILYGLYIVSFDNIQTVEISCPECGHISKEKLDIKDLYHVNKTRKLESITEKAVKEWYEKEYVIEDEKILPNGRIIVSDVSIKKVNEFLSTVEGTKLEEETDMYVPYIKRLEIVDKDGKVVESTTDILDIITEYKNMPLVLKKKIENVIDKSFKKYEPEFYVEWKCDKCGHQEKYYRNIPDEFFRMALGLGNN